jgi:FlaA1/EpsC-like NDP-sugar epimerase
LLLIRTAQKLKLIGADFLAALLAWVCFFLLRKYLLSEMTTGYRFSEGALFTLTGGAIMIATFWMALYAMIGEYRDIFRKSRLSEIIRLARVSILGALIIFFAFLLDDQGVSNYRLYYKTITAYFLLHFFISAILRTWAVTSVQHLVHNGTIFFNTLLVGSNSLAHDTYHELTRTSRHLGLKLVGFAPVGDTVDAALAAELPAHGSYKRLPALIRALHIEQVVIAIEPSEHRMIQEILTLLEGTPTRVSILPDLYQMLLGSVKVNHLFGTPLIEIKHDLLPLWQEVTKRGLDIVGSLLFLLLAWPVYAFTAIMVRSSSPGPIFYSQERVGKNAQPFRIYKFRSMYIDAEKMGSGTW